MSNGHKSLSASLAFLPGIERLPTLPRVTLSQKPFGFIGISAKVSRLV